MKSITIILIGIAVLATGNGFAQKMLKEWKHDMKLESSYGGGMSQFSYKLQINDSISYMDVIDEKGAKHIERKFTQQELNDILAFLAKNNFDKIESEHAGFAHDKGSESVMLKWDYEVIGASEGADMSIVEKYRDNFNVITAYIQGLFDSKKKK